MTLSLICGETLASVSLRGSYQIRVPESASLGVLGGEVMEVVEEVEEEGEVVVEEVVLLVMESLGI